MHPGDQFNPKYAAGYVNRGNGYARKKQYDRAIADFSQAIKLNPELWQYFYNRGKVYSEKRDYDRAITDFTQSIKLNPKLRRVYTSAVATAICKNETSTAPSPTLTRRLRSMPNIRLPTLAAVLPTTS